MKKKILVLGTGLVGKHIAVDLYKSGHEVSTLSLDKKPSIFENTPIKFFEIPFQIYPPSTKLWDTILDNDIIVNALPGKLGYEALEYCIRMKKDIVDISFMEEDPTNLKDLAKEKGVRVVTDIGVAPGLCGMMIGREVANMKKVQSAKIMVGGLPELCSYPHFYKAPFEPMGVIAEYTRPVRMRENGKDIIVDPLTDCEEVWKDCHVAFNTDGLRTLLTSFPNIPYMVEKTIRLKEHYDFICELQASGFFKPEHIENTAKVLIPEWKLDDNEDDYTIMKVIVTGDKSFIGYTLYDEKKDGVPSMARTTGYTCNAAVELIAQNKITEPGLYLPEELGADENHFQHTLSYLLDRGIDIERDTLK